MKNTESHTASSCLANDAARRHNLLSSLLPSAQERVNLAIAMAISLVCMLPEIGSGTFVSDFYHLQIFQTFPRDDFFPNGRFVPGAIFHSLFFSTYTPGIYLILCAASLIGSAYALVKALDEKFGKKEVLLTILFVFHPFWFPHYAYVENRLLIAFAAPLSILAAASATHARSNKFFILISSFLLTLSLLSYQPVVGLFFTSALFLATSRSLKTQELRSFFQTLLTAILIAVFSFSLYKLAVFFGNSFGIEQNRVDGMMRMPRDIGRLSDHLKQVLLVLRDCFFTDTQFFPLAAKILLLIVLSYHLFARQNGGALPRFFLLNFSLISFCSISFIFFPLLVYPFIPLARVMPGLAAVYFFIFYFPLKKSEGIAKYLIGVFALITVLVFIVQFNIMHERLLVKNEIDKEITQDIARKINDKVQGRFIPKLVILGTLSHKELPYWNKLGGVPKSSIYPNIIQSVYEYQWSNTRLLRFYLPFRDPSPEDINDAKMISRDVDPWPAKDSVFLTATNTAVVVLSQSQLVDYGVTYLFSDVKMKSHLANGWAQQEAWGVWSIDKEAAVELELADDLKYGLRVNLRCIGYSPNNEPQIISVKSNGTSLGSYKIDRNGSTINLIVPPGLISGNALTLTFDISHPSSPSSTGDSTDNRLLGIGLQSIQVNKI